MADKTYVGSAKEIGKFGSMKISLKCDQLKPNEKGYISLIMARRKAPDDHGNTHTVYVDTFVPASNRPKLPF